jgi:hypothetical protein
MTRLAVSPVLIAFGMALIVHFLSVSYAEWARCFSEAVDLPSPYRDYATYLLSNWSMAALVLGIPFLPFIVATAVLRAPERLYWLWIGILITIAVLVLALSNLASGQACDPDTIREYGIPELTPMIIGLIVSFPVCLIATYIGSVRHSRRTGP